MKETSLNFGAIKESILKVASNEILQENFKKSIFDNFSNQLKENNTLKKQFLVYKNFEKSKPFSKESLAERFINQNLNLFKNENWNNIINENKKLRLETLGDAHVEADQKTHELFENIHILIESVTKNGFSNYIKEQEAYEFLVKYLTRESEEKKSLEEAENPDFNGNFITQLAVSNFQKRYDHLNEEEKKVLNMLLSPSQNKENYILDLKEDITKIVSNLISEDNSNKNLLDTVSNKLNKVKIEESTMDDVIFDLTELKNTLKEIK